MRNFFNTSLSSIVDGEVFNFLRMERHQLMCFKSGTCTAYCVSCKSMTIRYTEGKRKLRVVIPVELLCLLCYQQLLSFLF